MKYVVVFTFVMLASALAGQFEDEMSNKLIQYAKQCKSEVGANDDDVAPVLRHKDPTTQNGKCFLACIKKKFGFLNASGKIDKDATYAFLEKLKPLMDEDLYTKMVKIADTCLAEVTESADECETAANIFKCYHREREQHGLDAIEFSE